MRTRHWKNLVRISGGTALVDNETLKMLTFGQLLDLNLHMHIDEVKQIVQKAIKDLSIEQTIKTYEEIWLSKIFNLKKYGTIHSEQVSKPISNDDDDKSSHDRRSSFSRIGVVQASSTTKSNKRLSIGSLPNSLLGLEPLGENEPIYLFESAESLFAELDHHQIVLQELLMNQSAGSFYDEIIKWQQTLQNIEAVLKVWNSVQNNWKRIESAYAMYEIQTILPQESASFFKTDRDFKVLMKATHKNSNILKCCQRKNILNILKHLNQNLEACYESLLQEMSKKRQKCPRLYLLNDEDLIELLCCGSNLENLSCNINKSYSHIKSLRFEINTLTNETSVIGCYDKNMEYLPFKTSIVYNGNVEDFINEFELQLKESLKYLLDLSLNGSLPPLPPPPHFNHSQSLNASQKLQVNKTQGLPSIKESNEADQSAAVQFSWILQHCTQVIEISLRVLFTNQIETCLNESKIDELKVYILNLIIQFKYENFFIL
jgi:dynein heavy chain